MVFKSQIKPNQKTKEKDFISLAMSIDQNNGTDWRIEPRMYVITKKLLVIFPKRFYKYQYLKTLCDKYNTPCLYKIIDAIQLIQTK